MTSEHDPKGSNVELLLGLFKGVRESVDVEIKKASDKLVPAKSAPIDNQAISDPVQIIRPTISEQTSATGTDEKTMYDALQGIREEMKEIKEDVKIVADKAKTNRAQKDKSRAERKRIRVEMEKEKIRAESQSSGRET